jgi:lipopolysaccharide/colanic/teichoic acid biosynthesis glycosyltransferase
MDALIPPQIQGARLARSHAAVEWRRDVDDRGPEQRLAETYAAHAKAGILPAKRLYVLKRLLDLVIAVPALMLTLPLYPFIMLLIRLDSPGPGLYRHTRVGKDGRPFVTYKFRTMRQASAEHARVAHLEIVTKWMAGTPFDVVAMSAEAAVASGEADLADRAQVLATGGRPPRSPDARLTRPHKRRKEPFAVAPRFKHTADSRITRVGRMLRKSSIDELPQLINVVRGEMSLVGPRPPMAYEVERYSERALARLRVLPGITGQWQVEGRGRVSFEQMVEMDLEYVARSSLAHDIALVVRTIPAVIRGSGAG